MENDNFCDDILKFVSDFERSMADKGSTSESTDNSMRVMDEVQVIYSSDNDVFNLVNYQSNQPPITTNDIDFKMHSPYLKLIKKLHRLESTKKSMRKELYEMKREINDLKEHISSLHEKLNANNKQKYRKNSVMGQLGIIREILIDIQTKTVKI